MEIGDSSTLVPESKGADISRYAVRVHAFGRLRGWSSGRHMSHAGQALALYYLTSEQGCTTSHRNPEMDPVLTERCAFEVCDSASWVAGQVAASEHD